MQYFGKSLYTLMLPIYTSNNLTAIFVIQGHPTLINIMSYYFKCISSIMKCYLVDKLRTVKAALTIQIIHPSTFQIVNVTVNIS